MIGNCKKIRFLKAFYWHIIQEYSTNILIKALNSTEKTTYKGKQGGKTFQYLYYVILINEIRVWNVNYLDGVN